jgi:ubiquinone/menaquinone biosynthesis C-methylase UbiE
MTDWRSYDAIAEGFDRHWSAQFEAVARRIWQLAAPRVGDSVLDIGTGTGILPAVLIELFPPPKLLAGCDRSGGMLRRARVRASQLRAVAADATTLPFASESFDRVTASFVVSHVPDYRLVFREAFRVARRSGLFAVSSWAADTDPHVACWNESLAAAITESEVRRAMAEVVPWQDHFAREGSLESALEEAGFTVECHDTFEVVSDLTVEDFVSGRELNFAARLGQSLLGEAGWARFRAATIETLRARFGPKIVFRRDALIAVGSR